MPFISVDVEASGPIPGVFDLLSVGAVRVLKNGDGYITTDDEFYMELKPHYGGIDPEAMRVHGMSIERLRAEGLEFNAAAEGFRKWVMEGLSDGYPPVFVGYCATFDWAYINDLFLQTGVINPFGYKALDLRALAMGAMKMPWLELHQDSILPSLGLPPLDPKEAHNALADARHQAKMLVGLLEFAGISDAIKYP